MSTQRTRRSSRNRYGSPVSKFLAWLGGAHAELVRDHPEETIRLSAIGATILFTGILAAFSSGYAFYTVFGRTHWVPVLAVLWSCMIVNIDRLVVMTIRGSFWRKVGGAVPRLLLAAFIAVVIARPLELLIFNPEVERAMKLEELRLRNEATERLHRAQRSAEDALKSGVEVAREALGVDRQRAVVDSINKQVTECGAGQARMFQEWSDEMNKSVGGRPSGPGPVSDQKLRMFNGKREECERTARSAESARQSAEMTQSQLNVSIKGLEDTRNTARQRAVREFEIYTTTLDSTRAGSLLARERALSALSSTEPDVGRMVLVVTLLFLLVEILPVIAKLMAGSTVYDAALSQRERTAMAITNGASAAETELKEAEEFSAKLHAQLLRQRAAFRRRALALQRIAVRDVLDQARTGWKAPSAVVDAMIEAMTKAAHEAVTGSSGVMAGEPPGPEDSVQHHSPPSTPRVQVRQYFTGHVPVVLVFLASLLAVVASFMILGWVDASSKNDLAIALAVGSLVPAILALGLSPSHGRLSHDAEGGRE
jgi:hypothetical protein